MYSWNSDDGLDQPLASANVNASANIDSGKVQLHSVQEKETGRVVPKGNPGQKLDAINFTISQKTNAPHNL